MFHKRFTEQALVDQINQISESLYHSKATDLDSATILDSSLTNTINNGLTLDTVTFLKDV